MPLLKRLVVGLICLILINCTQPFTPNNGHALELVINTDQPDRIRFSGKGAGAGMMLSGTMGAMGVAVGVAIDEGIGKEIEVTARSVNIDIKEIIEEAFHNVGQNYENKSVNKVVITIKRYGFVTSSGAGDPVLPQLQVSISTNNQNSQLIDYPDQFQQQQVFPLQNIKADAKLIKTAFEQAAQGIANLFFQNNTTQLK